MVDIYTSRRNKPYKCLYWKRNNLNYLNNEVIKTLDKPNGLFYASKSTRNTNDKQEIGGVFSTTYQRVAIETEDIIDIEKDDKVLLQGDIWLVLSTVEEPIQKNAFFLGQESKRTIIELAKGK